MLFLCLDSSSQEHSCVLGGKGEEMLLIPLAVNFTPPV
jgi:hypothetical protein